MAPTRVCPRVIGCLLCLSMAVTFSAGCGALIRREMDRRYPPVSGELRQLAVIRSSIAEAERLPKATLSVFLPASELSNYVRRVLAEPLPLTADAEKVLKEAPALSATDLRLGRQELVLSTDFMLVLARGTGPLDVSDVHVGGRLSVRLMPELLPAPLNGDAVIRLRPALSSVQVCDVDLSRSKLSKWQLLTKRGVVSGVINTAAAAFRDNLNGQLASMLVPLPFEPIAVGRRPEENGKDGVTLTPSVVALIDPFLTQGVIYISPEGVRIVGAADTRILEPNAPIPQPVPSPVFETVPAQASESEIALAYEALTNAVNRRLSEMSTVIDRPGQLTGDLATPVIASAINKAFEGRTLRADYSGPVKEERPCQDGDPCDPDPRELRLPGNGPQLHCENFDRFSCDPRGTCVPYFEGVAKDMLANAKSDCARLAGDLDRLGGDINKACEALCYRGVCLGDVVAPDTCAQARNRKEAIAPLKAACDATVQLTQNFLGAPQALVKDFADSIGQGPFFRDFCTFYDRAVNKQECELFKGAGRVGCESLQSLLDQGFKMHALLATIDWAYKGVDERALQGTVDLQRVRVSPSLETVDLQATGGGAMRVEGWFKHVQTNPSLLAACPPPPCLDHNNDCRIVLHPTTITFKLEGSGASATFGIQTFKDDTQQDRPGFFYDLNKLSITATVGAWPIQQLLRENNARLPCIFGALTWENYAIADLIVGLQGKQERTQDIDQAPTRIGWADGKMKVPVAWKPGGSAGAPPTVLKEVELGVTYSLPGGVARAKVQPFPELPAVAPSSFAERPFRLTGVLGMGPTFGGKAESGGGFTYQFGRYFSASPYLAIEPWRFPVSPMVGFAFGPRLAGPGFMLGASARPVASVPKLTVYGGARFGGGTRLVIGAGWEVLDLKLNACASDN
jgi:hypothetical protein